MKAAMKDLPPITVITVTYNALSDLKKTANSTWAQDYPNMEHIIVDGASDDGTKEWLEKIESQKDNESIRQQDNETTSCPVRWVSERDKGIYDAMNKATAMARGEFCIFMNAGDTFVNEHVISKMFGQADKETDVIYGDIMKNGQLKSSLSPRNCHKMFYCHQGVFTRTSCLFEIPFDIKHRYSADFKQAKQLFLAGKRFQHIDIPVANFDTNGVSNTQRSKGLWDNVRVVCEVDSLKDKCRFLPHLLFPWLMCKLRGK